MDICHPSKGEAPAGCGSWRQQQQGCYGGVSGAPAGNSHPLSGLRAAGAARGLWVWIIEIFLSLSLSSAARLKKGPGCRVCWRGLGLSGHYRGCRDIIGAAGWQLPLAAKERLGKRCPWVCGMDGCSFGSRWHPPAAERLAGKRSRCRGSSPARRLRSPSGPVASSRRPLALLPAPVPFWDGTMLPSWCRMGLIYETAVTSSWQPHLKAECIYAVCHPSSSAFSSPFLLLQPLPLQVLRSISVIALPSAITLLVDFHELALPGRCHPFPPLP